MSYNTDHLRTAGKITVYTSVICVLIFAVIFILNVGERKIKEAVADTPQNATTSVTVLNTPPDWTATTTEEIESSADNPTDAGDVVSWVAIATDSNAEDYYLLICDTNASPTANSGAAPVCASGVQWAVSTATLSGTEARAATTTLDAWSESNDWFAWVCDANVVTPKCSNEYTQGTNATNSSPFIVNHRPLFTVFVDDSPTDPGAVVTFTSTASDTDAVGAQDTVFLTVCSTSAYSTTTDTCGGVTLATSTAFVVSNATATYTVVIPTMDDDYEAHGFIIDNHGFEAAGVQGSDSILTVSNVAPTVSAASISLTQATTSTNMILTVESGETTGFTLSFTTDDNNSCENSVAGDEMTDFNLSIYRSGVGSSTCTVGAGSYNANNCYPSGLATTTWNLSCTASSTSCGDPTIDTDVVWDCTFPLWYIADPTDGDASTTVYFAENWLAQVQGIDDDTATGPLTESSSGVDVESFLAFALNTLSIPYGSLEPGQQTDPIVATTTISATGNVGLDKDVQGTSMCTTYTGSTPCANSATSTIDAQEQVFATSSVTYALGSALSSTTPQEIEINVPKSISTSTPTTSDAFWGIRVPGTITFAGDYYGENTFTAIVGEPGDW